MYQNGYKEENKNGEMLVEFPNFEESKRFLAKSHDLKFGYII